MTRPNSPLRVGLIVPSSNTVMEPDLHRYFRESAVVSTTRMLLSDVTREAESIMLRDSLPGAINLIATTSPAVVVFGCTSAGALVDATHDQGIARMIEQETGATAITVLRAVLRSLRELSPRRVAVFTPYVEDLTAAVARSILDDGHNVVKAAGMGIGKNLEIGRITPYQIVRFVESQMSGVTADCIFLSCTNWQAIDAIGPLRAKFSMPVISSNQAAIAAVDAFRAS